MRQGYWFLGIHDAILSPFLYFIFSINILKIQWAYTFKRRNIVHLSNYLELTTYLLYKNMGPIWMTMTNWPTERQFCREKNMIVEIETLMLQDIKWVGSSEVNVYYDVKFNCLVYFLTMAQHSDSCILNS